jgi:hypothetical protein
MHSGAQVPSLILQAMERELESGEPAVPDGQGRRACSFPNRNQEAASESARCSIFAQLFSVFGRMESTLQSVEAQNCSGSAGFGWRIQ